MALETGAAADIDMWKWWGDAAAGPAATASKLYM